MVQLGLIVAVGDDVLSLQAQIGGDFGDGLHFGGLGNFAAGHLVAEGRHKELLADDEDQRDGHHADQMCIRDRHTLVYGVCSPFLFNMEVSLC